MHLLLESNQTVDDSANKLSFTTMQVLTQEGVWKSSFDFWYFNATFSNISAISWRPVLAMEEAGVPGENH